MSALSQQALEIESRVAPSGTKVRVAEPADREFVMSLAPGLVASGLPRWRDPRKMLAAYVEVIDGILRPEGVEGRVPRSDAALLIAEDGNATSLGFVLLVAATDCYTQKRHGHVAQIVIARIEHELSVGMELLAAAEAWARSRGCRVLTRNEFWLSHPASAVYCAT